MYQFFLKNFLDLLIAFLAFLFFFPLLFIISIVIKLESRGPALHWSKRVGIRNKIFLMPKFRTMRIDTPQVATHLLTNSSNYITAFGQFLRRTSLDELPQILSVLKGDMSIVGPRPALFNQDDLVDLRTKQGVHLLVPGITGWAQINGRDSLPIPEKVNLDSYYLKHRSLKLDLFIITKTVMKVLCRADISH